MSAHTTIRSTSDRVSDTAPGRVQALPSAHGASAHHPSLTALRALAISVIVLSVGARSLFSGGHLVGVEVLFVVSGYLLTAATFDRPLTTWRHGLLRLAARVRRLLPGLLIMLGGLSLFVLVRQPGELRALGADTRAALVGMTNWQMIQTADPSSSLLAHLWPIAVGVQLTAVIVVALVLVRTRRHQTLLAASFVVLAVVAAVGLVLSSRAGVEIRALVGTDSRATGLLLGAALGMTVRPGGAHVIDGPRGRRLRMLGALAVVGLLVTTILGGPTSEWLGRGGMLLVDLFAVLAVAVAVRGGAHGVARALPVQWLGARSYALYVWYWPLVAAFADAQRMVSPTAMVGYVVALLVLGDLTYRFVEVPLRATRVVRGTGRPGGSDLAVGVVAIACGTACAAALLASPA